MKTVRIYKAHRDAPNAFGAFNKKWETEHYVVAFAGRPFVEISEGEVYDKETKQPVPLLDLLADLIAQNRQTMEMRTTGRVVKQQFNAHWKIDYHPELKEFFETHKLLIPVDGKSEGERMTDVLFKNAEMQGLITRGLATTDSAAGVRAVYEAKLKVEEESLAKVRAEKQKLIDELKSLKAEHAEKAEKKEKAKV